MRSIRGRVLVRETGTPAPNVVIVVHRAALPPGAGTAATIGVARPAGATLLSSRPLGSATTDPGGWFAIDVLAEPQGEADLALGVLPPGHPGDPLQVQRITGSDQQGLGDLRAHRDAAGARCLTRPALTW